MSDTMVYEPTPDRKAVMHSDIGKLFPGAGFVNVLDYGADPEGADIEATTAALEAVLGGTASSFGPGANQSVLLPPGVYTTSRSLTIAPTVDLISAYGATIRLADGAVSKVGFTHVLKTDHTVNNGDLSILGLTIDGNDEGQFPEAEDPLAGSYNRSSGFYLCTGETLRLVDVAVRHTRGHGINHWNWEDLFVDGYKVMQMVNPVTPAGGRRRDGITGASRRMVIQGVQGYTADDLVAAVAGANWGPLGAAGAIDILTLNVSNVSPQVSEDNGEIKAWRGVVLYAQNGGRIRSAVVDGVAGETKLAHVYVRTEAENSGSVNALAIDNIVGASQSFIEDQSFITISHTRIDQLTIGSVVRRADSTSSGGATSVPVTPTLIIKDTTWVKYASISSISSIQGDVGAGRDVDLIRTMGTARIDVLDVGRAHLDQPYAATKGKLTLLRHSSSQAAPLLLRGIPRHRCLVDNGGNLVAGVADGTDEDANQLTSTGTYGSDGTGANWPVDLAGNSQMMHAVRFPSGKVMQTVTRDRDDLSRTYTRTRGVDGVWTEWKRPATQDQTAWNAGTSVLETVLSPEKLAATIKKLTGFRAGGIPGDNTDANVILSPGFYATLTPNTPNWPSASQYQVMEVFPTVGGIILQKVTRFSSNNQTMLSTRFSLDGGATWSAWQQLTAYDLAKFKEGIDIIGSLISPATLNGFVNQGGTTANRPTGNARKLYMEYKDTTLGIPIWWDGTNWRNYASPSAIV